jgi:hypothetical protein
MAASCGLFMIHIMGGTTLAGNSGMMRGQRSAKRVNYCISHEYIDIFDMMFNKSFRHRLL